MILRDNMFTVTGGTHDNVKIRLNADHAIYRAHFPGNPITPGVCIVQMIGELLADRCGRRLSLSQIVNLKFVAPISPVEVPDVEINFQSVDDNGTECKAKGTIGTDGALLTKFSVIYK
ncbi:MAG: beta-hydroxyacyl-ACP dehydratase [Prevotella sp.]|nr:beta-hydroxyacyl-ACP dehydratase [Prevotella sp.]